MDWAGQIASWLRGLLAQLTWLEAWRASIARTPDWALLAGAATLLLALAAPVRLIWPWRGSSPSVRRAPPPSAPTREAAAQRAPSSAAPLATASSAAPAATPRPQPASETPAPPAPADDEDNRSVRVFVSSTFLDMQAERDELVTKAFPALRAKYRARGVEVFEVDLRWGVTQQMQERGDTLPTLLAEADRCRPYFIGLLGDRYGWTPPPLSEKLRNDYPAIARADGMSVTAMEIMHGVLADPSAAGRALFFERDANWDWVTPLSEADRADAKAESDDARAKLADLKAAISSNARIEPYAKPEDIAQKAFEALDALLEARFPEQASPDAFEQSARLHRAYARERRGLHVGAGAYLSELDRWMAAKDAPPKLITGASGGGKSTLVANWLEAWRRAHPNDIVFEHYLGASPDSADPIVLMRRLWERLNRATGEIVEPPGADAEVMDVSIALAQRLAQARLYAERSGGQVLIALDGLDKLSSEQNLRWLPIVPGVHVLASSLDGEAKSAALARGFAALEVNPLDENERQAFIAGTLARWRRELEPAHIARILQPQTPALAGSPLYLKTVLEELRVSADHARLAERLEVYRGARDMADLFDRVLKRLEEDCEPGVVAKALPLIWASRAGLEETEIIAITGATPLAWATLRNGLGEGLRDQGGRMAFGHDFLRQAVESRYLNSEEAKRAAHLAVADRFAARAPDARQAEELPFQLRAAQAWERLEALLCDLERFDLLRARGDGELWGYWLALKGRGGDPEALLCAAFEARAGEADAWTKDDAELALALTGFLNFAGAYGAACTRLQRHLAAASERLFGPEHPNVATGLNNLAELLRATNRHGEAEPLYRRALAIDEASFGPDHPEVATDLNNLAALYYATNRHGEAEPLFRRALAIDEASFGPDHPNVAIRLNNLAGLYDATNRHGEAEPLYRRALAIDEASFGPDHPNVAAVVNNLAGLYRATSRHGEAEPLYRRALAIDEASFGPDHPNVARGLNNLALLLEDTNRHGEAELLYRRALAIDEASFGPDHPNVAIRLNNLAALYDAANRHGEAEPLFRRALAILEASFGPDHPNTRIVAKGLALCVAALRKR